MKIVQLKLADRGYSKEVVADLEDLLDRAKRGEIISLAYVAEKTGDEGIEVGYTPCDDVFAQLGAAYHLLHKLQERIDDDTREITA